MSSRVHRIKEIVSECIYACPISPEEMKASTTLREDLGGDSIEMVELSMALEEEFKVAIDDEKIEGFKTVGEIIDYINEASED